MSKKTDRIYETFFHKCIFGQGSRQLISEVIQSRAMSSGSRVGGGLRSSSARLVSMSSSSVTVSSTLMNDCRRQCNSIGLPANLTEPLQA